MVTCGNMINEHAKTHRLAAAVEQDTYTTVQDIALQTYRTTSQVVNSYIVKGILESELILETSKVEYDAKVLANKSDELVRNLKKIDVFYDFKVNFWQICLILGGKIRKNISESPESAAFRDLISIIEEFREDKPMLYEDCVVIMRKTLNKGQRELLLA